MIDANENTTFSEGPRSVSLLTNDSSSAQGHPVPAVNDPAVVHLEAGVGMTRGRWHLFTALGRGNKFSLSFEALTTRLNMHLINTHTHWDNRYTNLPRRNYPSRMQAKSRNSTRSFWNWRHDTGKAPTIPLYATCRSDCAIGQDWFLDHFLSVHSLLAPRTNGRWSFQRTAALGVRYFHHTRAWPTSSVQWFFFPLFCSVVFVHFPQHPAQTHTITHTFRYDFIHFFASIFFSRFLLFHSCFVHFLLCYGMWFSLLSLYSLSFSFHEACFISSLLSVYRIRLLSGHRGSERKKLI